MSCVRPRLLNASFLKKATENRLAVSCRSVERYCRLVQARFPNGLVVPTGVGQYDAVKSELRQPPLVLLRASSLHIMNLCVAITIETGTGKDLQTVPKLDGENSTMTIPCPRQTFTVSVGCRQYHLLR